MVYPLENCHLCGEIGSHNCAGYVEKTSAGGVRIGCSTCQSEKPIYWDCPVCDKRHAISGNKQRDLRIAERVKNATIAWIGLMRLDVANRVPMRALDLSKIIAEVSDAPEVCEWKYNEGDDEMWQASCGKDFCFYEGEPSDNDYKFCPNCGKVLVQKIIAEVDGGR